ncbi:Fur family transcriptional regulator [Marinicrinis sediminis]|uniref:Fur family transcriptional regulator n=1 Tax=Marinicrinis sediminis TaxID=1652465 RepID=A0ABW5RBQ8_9BACL
MSRARHILEVMDQCGLRITDQRKTLAAIFEETHQPLTPKKIYGRMNEIYKGLSLDTVYRNLRKLVDIGAIEPITFPDGVRYQVKCTHVNHHHHLICLSCEQTMPIEMCPIELGIGIPEKFQIVQHTFQIHGYCAICSEDKHE